jgi:hypothetical protein
MLSDKPRRASVPDMLVERITPASLTPNIKRLVFGVAAKVAMAHVRVPPPAEPRDYVEGSLVHVIV